jgi:hypothetical protein
VPRRKSWIAILAFLTVATALTTAFATPDAYASTPLSAKLRVAKHELSQAHDRLKAAEAALAAALAGTTAPTVVPSGNTSATTPTVAQLKAQVAKARKAVHVWQTRVTRIARRVHQQAQIADWELHAKWMPIIQIAAAKYHVKADGMYRMMMRESGGRRTAGAGGAYKGLFQYWTGTWAASWNPWRHDSIYDGSSQIFATAYAISKGMGPQMWTTTFASQY